MEEMLEVKVDNASLISHNPFSTKAIKAWQADMLSVTFVLSRFDSNNLNSAICLINEFYGTIKLIELEDKNEYYLDYLWDMIRFSITFFFLYGFEEFRCCL